VNHVVSELTDEELKVTLPVARSTSNRAAHSVTATVLAARAEVEQLRAERSRLRREVDELKGTRARLKVRTFTVTERLRSAPRAFFSSAVMPRLEVHSVLRVGWMLRQADPDTSTALATAPPTSVAAPALAPSTELAVQMRQMGRTLGSVVVRTHPPRVRLRACAPCRCCTSTVVCRAQPARALRGSPRRPSASGATDPRGRPQESLAELKAPVGGVNWSVSQLHSGQEDIKAHIDLSKRGPVVRSPPRSAHTQHSTSGAA
jgi:hypothetical protein